MEWRNTVRMKDYVEYLGEWSEDVAEAQRANARAIASSLRRVYDRELALLEKVEDGHVVVNAREALDADTVSELETVISDFEFLGEVMDGNEIAEEYGGDTWEDMFNGYLEALYDLGDTIVGEREKFMFLK